MKYSTVIFAIIIKQLLHLLRNHFSYAQAELFSNLDIFILKDLFQE